jgi:hypothetical protein
MQERSRIDAARRRAGTLKRVLVGGAAAAFVLAGIAARATHPGTAATRSSSSSSTRAGSVSEDGRSSQSRDFSIAPSTSQPRVQTGVS